MVRSRHLMRNLRRPRPHSPVNRSNTRPPLARSNVLCTPSSPYTNPIELDTTAQKEDNEPDQPKPKSSAPHTPSPTNHRNINTSIQSSATTTTTSEETAASGGQDQWNSSSSDTENNDHERKVSVTNSRRPDAIADMDLKPVSHKQHGQFPEESGHRVSNIFKEFNVEPTFRVLSAEDFETVATQYSNTSQMSDATTAQKRKTMYAMMKVITLSQFKRKSAECRTYEEGMYLLWLWYESSDKQG